MDSHSVNVMNVMKSLIRSHYGDNYKSSLKLVNRFKRKVGPAVVDLLCEHLRAMVLEEL